MNSNEAYLDSLLAALNGEPEKETIVTEEPVDVQEEIPELVSEKSDENKEYIGEEIATLFATDDVDVMFDDIPEDTQEEAFVIAEEFPGDAVEEPEAEEEEPEEEEPEEEVIETPEPVAITPISDDPNKALGADEIAALFAQANVDMITGDAVEEPEAEEELEEEVIETSEPVAITPISDDPNKALGADEIAALFAQANVDMTTGDAVEEPEAEEELEEEVIETSEPVAITPISDDPNKALGADEIAALFAQANVDMETGDAAENSFDEASEEQPESSMSLDDMLAQMTEADEIVEEETEENTIESIQEEIEIDMDNPEELEL